MRYSAETTASATEIIRRAREAFGPTGAGLPMSNLGFLQVEFRADIGFVALTIEPADGRNTVTIETRELDAEVRRFLEQLPHRRSLRQLLRRWRSNRKPSTRP